jgi:hypothetical protein
MPLLSNCRLFGNQAFTKFFFSYAFPEGNSFPDLGMKVKEVLRKKEVKLKDR